MSDMAEEVEDQESLTKSNSKISGEILDGKRAKKSVERFDFQAPKQKEKLKFGDGSGDKLGDIPRTGHQITRMKAADLKPLHFILFDRPGKMASLKKNLRLFNGFPFDADSGQYSKKREKLLKNSNFTNTKLKVVCGVLDLEKKGTHPDLVDRILTFLTAPKNSGKRLPVKKKRKSKKKLSGEDSKSNSKKKSNPRPSSSSSSPKKSKPGSKSKAIVMDSSSDEEEEEEEEEEEKAGAEGSDTEDKPSEKEEDQSDKSEESSDEEEEDESPKSKSGRGKSASKTTAPVKRPRTPTKKTGPPKKRAKKDVSEESESEADEKPMKKKSAPVKPAPKTKKADSSSNSKNNLNTAADSSDDDAPLIKMVKKSPSEEQLKETVKTLLEEADLEEMTMKQICQRVFDTFPNHDLTSKKDYIKQTVKSLIT
ncbi:protein DEK isoform X1 [Cyclopterus lumpus]|uniref:protein DEK isoform X1 n=2 Tax=Cyclopterus lumpus TaxID=8103 RepID=UPI00148607C9|nr:protein DEK isoform X1 [Cyclopterus lumpus]XP_034410032.1 protein DEK isoform X1 [Cyclopterus lumpus]